MAIFTKNGRQYEITARIQADAFKHAGWKEATDAEPADLSSMTTAKLKKYAAERGLDLGGASSKDEIIAAIEAAQN